MERGCSVELGQCPHPCKLQFLFGITWPLFCYHKGYLKQFPSLEDFNLGSALRMYRLAVSVVVSCFSAWASLSDLPGHFAGLFTLSRLPIAEHRVRSTVPVKIRLSILFFSCFLLKRSTYFYFLCMGFCLLVCLCTTYVPGV